MNSTRLNIIPIPETRYISVWNQPQRKAITLDDTHAMMNRVSFDRLLDYSYSQPSGVWIGKMWKQRHETKEWTLCWFGISDKPGYLSNNYRKILILEDEDMEMGLDDVLDFGRYQGKQIEDVIEDHPDWIVWAIDRDVISFDDEVLELITKKGII